MKEDLAKGYARDIPLDFKGFDVVALNVTKLRSCCSRGYLYFRRVTFPPAQWSVTARAVVPSRLKSNRICMVRRDGVSTGGNVHFLAASVASRWK